MSENLFLDPELTGRAFAHAEAKEQAALFNSFAHHLKILCHANRNGALSYGADGQLGYIVDSLDGLGAWLVQEMAQWLQFHEEHRAEKARKEPDR